MKPFFSYYGGRQRMANKIIPLIPKHTVYCEPFSGRKTIKTVDINNCFA